MAVTSKPFHFPCLPNRARPPVIRQGPFPKDTSHALWTIGVWLWFLEKVKLFVHGRRRFSRYAINAEASPSRYPVPVRHLFSAGKKSTPGYRGSRIRTTSGPIPGSSLIFESARIMRFEVSRFTRAFCWSSWISVRISAGVMRSPCISGNQ